MPKDWIAGATKAPKGTLREKLGAKPDQDIPTNKLQAAAKAKGKLGKEARLAETLKGFRK